MSICPVCYSRTLEPPPYTHVARIARAVLDVAHRIPAFEISDMWSTSPEFWECHAVLGSTGRVTMSLNEERLYVEIGLGPGYRTLSGYFQCYEYSTSVYLDDHSMPQVSDVVKTAMYMLYGLRTVGDAGRPSWQSVLASRPRDEEGRFIK